MHFVSLCSIGAIFLLFFSCGSGSDSEPEEAAAAAGDFEVTEQQLDSVLLYLDTIFYPSDYFDGNRVGLIGTKSMEEDSMLKDVFPELLEGQKIKRYLKYQDNWFFYPEVAGLDTIATIKALGYINNDRLTLTQKKELLEKLLLDQGPVFIYRPLFDEEIRVEVTSSLSPRTYTSFHIDGFWLPGKGKVQKKVLPLYPDSVSLRVLATNNPGTEFKGKITINQKSKEFKMATNGWKNSKLFKFAIKDFALDTNSYRTRKPVPPTGDPSASK
jgi:hypothetical protein